MNFQPAARIGSVPRAPISTTVVKVASFAASKTMSPSVSQLQMTTGKTVAGRVQADSAGFLDALCCCCKSRHTRSRLRTPSTERLARPEALELRDLRGPVVSVSKAVRSNKRLPPTIEFADDETGLSGDETLPGSPSMSIATPTYDHKETWPDPEKSVFTGPGTSRRLSCSFEEPLLDLFRRCYPDGQISSAIFDDLNPNTLDHLSALLESPSMKKFMVQYPVDFAQRFNGLTIMGLRGPVMSDAIELGVLTIDHLRVIDRLETRRAYDKYYPNHPLNINLIRRLINNELLTQRRIKSIKKNEHLTRADKAVWINGLNANKITMDKVLGWNLTFPWALSRLQELCE